MYKTALFSSFLFRLLFIVVCFSLHAESQEEEGFSVSSEEAQRIAQKIWQNECRGTLEGLTTWRQGEEFASLGIGHFIWYPKEKKGPFEETFPSLLLYLQKSGALIPDFLLKSRGCLWNSKEEFDADLKSERMQQLATFLYETREQQALFMAKRLEKLIPLLIASLPKEDCMKGKEAFYTLANDERGLYALIDYVNFKGSGLSTSERYKGQGWGLLQVLSQLPSSFSDDPVLDFEKAAKKILQERVQNAPEDKKQNEQKWLEGWINRVSSYSKLPY